MEKKHYDVIVIGGGPAGMMTAAVASDRGLSVLLLEKNGILGKKLLITGGGRCNITNNRQSVRDLALAYGQANQFLFSMFSQHAVADSLAYFKQRGLETKEENDGRLFPVTNSARSVQTLLLDHLTTSRVSVKTKVSVVAISKKSAGEFLAETTKGSFSSTNCVVATGGTARPETGSTGDGFSWLEKFGHQVSADKRALVPLTTADAWSKTLGGVALADVGLTVMVDGHKQNKSRGKILFTHVGVSGPAILNLSQSVGEWLLVGPVVILLDLCPNSDRAVLRTKLQAALVEQSNKKIKNILTQFIPVALAKPILSLINLDGETPAHSVRSQDRVKMAAKLKALPITIAGLQGTDKAVVAGGGVDLVEVNFKTMESRLVPGLFLVGDILNINRPSGGYSLQLCWSSAQVAGKHLK